MRNFRLKNLLIYKKTLIGIFKYARNPIIITFFYILRRNPKEMHTKHGLIIKPSSNPHDIITFVVVFCKKDYGEVKRGAIVIDVGANIGLFALEALKQGAKLVECFEPCTESFNLLKKNIKINGFEKNVKLHNKAVSSEDDQTVWIPISSSPYNKISEVVDNSDNKFKKIQTVSLEKCLESYDEIQLIKMDCEGAEFKILPSLSAKFLDKTNEIRMELHGTLEQLINCFSYQPFEIVSKGGNDYWLKKINIE